jgi:hypothetical protein
VETHDPTSAEGVVALTRSRLTRFGVGTDAGIALPVPQLRGLGGWLTLPRPLTRALEGRAGGRVALATILLLCLAIVLVTSSGPTILVSRSGQSFPGWEAGPLAGLIGRPLSDTMALAWGMSVVTVLITLAYLVVLGALRTLSLRLIVGAIIALHVILLLGPPLPLTDVFNYIGYARLGALHGINPYVHGIGMEPNDPVHLFSTWYHLKSPYGPLFTVLSYGVAFMPLAFAYWTVKLVTVALSLVFLWLVVRVARLLGRDPRYALAFVGLNPAFLIFELGAFHNDFFMLVPMIGATALVVTRRERWAGALLMAAVAVKFTAILLLPFLFVAIRRAERRRRLIVGCVAGAVPLVVMSLVFFGPHLPDLSDQSTLLTDFSIPNLLGWMIGLQGGAPLLLRLANVGVVVVAALLLRGRRPWLEGAGWATLALICALAWLMPWYVVWLLPLAALGSSLPLRRITLVLTVYLILTFLPAAGQVMDLVNVHPLDGGPGIGSRVLQQKLSG